MEDSYELTVKHPNTVFELYTQITVSQAFNPNKVSTDYKPEVIQVNGLWDTGANCSCISERVAKALNLKVHAQSIVEHAKGTDSRYTYAVNINIPKIGMPFYGLYVNEFNAPDDFDVLIGMDIINSGDFAISNFNGKTTLTFRVPSKAEIDFESESL
ncbi:MAG: retroviral-like aspartic protease family protein [Bacteroidota bacterium]